MASLGMLAGLALSIVIADSREAGAAGQQEDSPTEALMRIEADYLDAVAALPAEGGHAQRAKGYAAISPRDLVTDHRLGQMKLGSLADLIAHPSLGRRFEVRGRLRHFDLEYGHLGVGPRSYRLHRIEDRAGTGRVWGIFLDLGSVNQGERDIVDRFCGWTFACEATVYGWVDEIAAEREVNAFSPNGGITAVVGLAVQRIAFHGVAR